ncbi:MAG: hypothetical protein Q9186_003712 [Xanthomendoza sp. 1 TL-2023]
MKVRLFPSTLTPSPIHLLLTQTPQFMRRAAAAAASSPASPSSPDQTPINGPSSKRRKTSTTTAQSPLLPQTPSADTLAFQAAADAEDAKRVAAIEQIAAKVGETKWVLSTADHVPANGAEDGKLRFLTAGFSEIDQDSFGTGRQGEVGRRKFGRWKGKEEVGIHVRFGWYEAEQDDNDSDNKNEASGTSGSDTDPTKASKHRDQAPMARTGDYNRKTDPRSVDITKTKEPKLGRLTSISGGGGGASGGLAGVECYFCGEKGHEKADCPKKERLKRRRKDR